MTINDEFLNNKSLLASLISGAQYCDTPFSVRSVAGGFAYAGDMIHLSELIVCLEHILLVEVAMAVGVDTNRIEASKAFQLYATYKTICLISFSTIITTEQISELSANISNLFRLALEIDHEFKITPKLHHLTHYPDLIRMFGPLIQFSTLSFERKHQYFKKWAKLINNTINPSYSLANRHQYHQSIVMKDYEQTKFDFNHQQNVDPQFMAESTSSFHQQRPSPFPLKKNIARRIGQSGLRQDRFGK